MISIVAAIGKNRELGKDNKLLWHIPEDLKRFKEITSGHPIIMGRKTFESIGRPLPNRLNIVITRNQESRIKNQENLQFVSSLEKAINIGTQYEENKKMHNTKYEILNTGDEVFVIGGGQIFEQAIHKADRLYLTIVDSNFDADVFFPEYESEFTKETFRQEGKSGDYSYTFINLER